MSALAWVAVLLIGLPLYAAVARSVGRIAARHPEHGAWIRQDPAALGFIIALWPLVMVTGVVITLAEWIGRRALRGGGL